MARGLKKARFDFDRKLDGLLTSRLFGFPLMLLILAAVFWLTIEGANVPSAFLASILIDTGHPLLIGVGESLSVFPGGSAASSSTGCTWPRPGWWP